MMSLRDRSVKQILGQQVSWLDAGTREDKTGGCRCQESVQELATW